MIPFLYLLMLNLSSRHNSIQEVPESRTDWMLNLFWYAGKNDKKIKYYKVGQEGNDAQQIYSTAFLDEKMNYIHHNPVKAELVGNPEDYLYSSARDYAGEKGQVVPINQRLFKYRNGSQILSY